MSEESPSGENINGNNSIVKRKRKKTVSMVDLSIRKEGSSVTSNYLHNSSSASKRLKKDTEESLFSDRVKGEDGVSCFNLLLVQTCQVHNSLPNFFSDKVLGGFSHEGLSKSPFKAYINTLIRK